VFQRESVDNKGKALTSSIHYGEKYQNAFWNGQQMVFGDGDGQYFRNFTGSLDVIAHELTHGVTGFSAQLAYTDQTGALNESMSDVFASLVKQWQRGQTVDEADWLIGSEVAGPALKGRALRDMANPGTAFPGDPQPGHMNDYVTTEDDHGGVHINSGIPNRAFVLAARAIGGNSWEAPGAVWYKTLTERLTSGADFRKCAEETVSVARDLYPGDPTIAQKIADAWVQVGVLEAAAPIAAGALPAFLPPLLAAFGPPLLAATSVAGVPASFGDLLIGEQMVRAGTAKVIVVLNPDAPAQAAAASIRGTGPSTSVEDEIGQFFVPTGGEAVAAVASLRPVVARGRRGSEERQSEEGTPRLRVFPRLGLALGTVDGPGMTALRTHPRVKSVHAAPALNLIHPVQVQSGSAPTASTWGLRRLNILDAWKKGFTGKGVVVGHLDTGVDGSHPSLRGAIAAFAEFDFAGNQVVGARAHDSARHGTHTAGTIVGRPGQRGKIGVAPDAKLASALCIEGGQVIDRILGGLEWIVAQKARVLSMSVGLPGYTPAFEELIAALRRNAVLPVIAIGNEGAGTSRSPGNYANVLSVGAFDENDQVADFSSSQTFALPQNRAVPLLVGPGVNVLSSVPGGGYDLDSGTSMATPHIAGLAALLFQAMPNATIDAVEAAIIASCRLPATMTRARAGHGVPDAVSALAILQEPGNPAPGVQVPADANAD
jgi:subtilisin family serine protease